MDRYIFDLDGTLLFNNGFEKEREFLRRYLEKEFVSKIGDYLWYYENKYRNYDIDRLSWFLTNMSGYNISPEIILEWINFDKNLDDKLIDGVEDLLSDLKDKGKSLVVLTNWFSETQVPRLIRAGIYDYFDDVVTGDYVLKPHRESYLKAAGAYDLEKCVMIGDSLYKDYIGPRAIGMNSVLYDYKNIHNKNIVKVKRMIDVIDLWR